MVFNKDIGAVFTRKTKNKKQKKNEKKQKQQRRSSPILISQTSGFSSVEFITNKQNLTDFVRDSFTKLYSISRGKMLASAADHTPMRINSLEICCENSCVVPGLKISTFATGPALPVSDEIASVVDNISIESSSIIDNISLSDRKPWSPIPVLKTFDFDRQGQEVVEDTPPRLTYAFASNVEREGHISEKLISYRSSKERKSPKPSHEPPVPTIDMAPREPKGETMEEVLKIIRNHKAVWTNDEGRKLDQRVRRKILEGSYPNFTVMEEKLPSLLRFVWKSKLKKVTKYLEDETKHHKINRPDRLGRTALHFAASWGDTKIVKLLLKVPGIKLNLKDGNDMTPLFKAVEANSLSCVKLLVEAGAKARIPCRDNRTVVEYAIMEFGDECFPIVEYLYKERGLRDIRNAEDHMTLLHQTILTKSHVPIIKTIEMMLDCDVDMDAIEGNGRTPLILATIANRSDIVYTLLRNFADVDIYDDFMKNAIRYAKEGSECYKLLSKCRGTATRVLQPIHTPPKVQPVVVSNDNKKIKRMNPKMDDPEYQKFITNLFLATKYKN